MDMFGTPRTSFPIKVKHEDVLRRFSITPSRTYEQLATQIAALFGLKPGFKLFYLDDEGDYVRFSSEQEFKCALEIFSGSLATSLKIMVKEEQEQEQEPEPEPERDACGANEDPAPRQTASTSTPETPEAVHARVECDGCGVLPIRGVRFKCLICDDFDLCANCDAAKAESEQHHHTHAMVKMTLPMPLASAHFEDGNGRRVHPVPLAQPVPEPVSEPEPEPEQETEPEEGTPARRPSVASSEDSEEPEEPLLAPSLVHPTPTSSGPVECCTAETQTPSVTTENAYVQTEAPSALAPLFASSDTESSASDLSWRSKPRKFGAATTATSTSSRSHVLSPECSQATGSSGFQVEDGNLSSVSSSGPGEYLSLDGVDNSHPAPDKRSSEEQVRSAADQGAEEEEEQAQRQSQDDDDQESDWNVVEPVTRPGTTMAPSSTIESQSSATQTVDSKDEDESLWKSSHSLPPPPPQLDCLDRWEDLMSVLESMGFDNSSQNRQLLVSHNGNLQDVLDELLG